MTRNLLSFFSIGGVVAAAVAFASPLGIHTFAQLSPALGFATTVFALLSHIIACAEHVAQRTANVFETKSRQLATAMAAFYRLMRATAATLASLGHRRRWVTTSI